MWKEAWVFGLYLHQWQIHETLHTLEQLTGVLLVCERGRFAGVNDPEKRSGRRCRLSCTAVGQGLDIFPKCAEAVSVPGRHLVPLN